MSVSTAGPTVLLALLLALLLHNSPALAQFPQAVNPSALPMHLYPVQGSGSGDLSCGATTNVTQLTQARQLAIAQYSNLKEAQSFAAYDAGMRGLWDAADEGVRVVVPAAGVYTGIEDVIEYISLVVGVVNDGYAYYYNSSSSNLQYFAGNASLSFDVAQKAKFYCSTLPSETDAGECQTEELDSLSLHHVSFKPCTALIKQYVIAYDDVQNYMATKGARAATVCARHSKHCTGENRQFADFMGCMEFMESIPFVTCAAQVFNGDNMVCRFKHSFMVQFRPDTHCPHLGRTNTKCTDADCGGDFSCDAQAGALTYSPKLAPQCCEQGCEAQTRVESRCAAAALPGNEVYNR